MHMPTVQLTLYFLFINYQFVLLCVRDFYCFNVLSLLSLIFQTEVLSYQLAPAFIVRYCRSCMIFTISCGVQKSQLGKLVSQVPNVPTTAAIVLICHRDSLLPMSAASSRYLLFFSFSLSGINDSQVHAMSMMYASLVHLFHSTTSGLRACITWSVGMATSTHAVPASLSYLVDVALPTPYIKSPLSSSC